MGEAPAWPRIASTTRTRAASRRSVSSLRYEDIPEEVRQRIKLLVLDSLGCGLYGAHLPWTDILRDTLTGLDATRTTPIWGTDQALSAPNAALLNGTQIQGFELDDVHRQGVLHVGAVTLPAAARHHHARQPAERPRPADRSGGRL